MRRAGVRRPCGGNRRPGSEGVSACLEVQLRYRIARRTQAGDASTGTGCVMTGKGAVNRDGLRRTSAPALLCERARSAPGQIAFRSKHLGIYRERTFRDYALLVSGTAKALVALGIAKGDRVAI